MEAMTENSFQVPERVREALLSPVYPKNQRIAQTVDWFKYHRGKSAPSNIEFANELSIPIKPLGLSFHKQAIWGYSKGKNIPLPDKFKILAREVEHSNQQEEYAWQYEFAKIILQILED